MNSWSSKPFQSALQTVQEKPDKLFAWNVGHQQYESVEGTEVNLQ